MQAWSLVVSMSSETVRRLRSDVTAIVETKRARMEHGPCVHPVRKKTLSVACIIPVGRETPAVAGMPDEAYIAGDDMTTRARRNANHGTGSAGAGVPVR